MRTPLDSTSHVEKRITVSAPLSAVIAGGGIGGLATAIALARRGVDVRVCERRDEFPEDGAGIQIGPNGARILEDLGVTEFLVGKVASPDALIVHDGKTGRELTRLPLGAWIAERHGAPYWTAHRRDLHQALRARAKNDPGITLSLDTEITACTNAPDGISASSANGDAMNASILVAADGLWSNLRRRIGDSTEAPMPIGKTAFRSMTAAQNLTPQLDGNAVHIWLSPGAHAVHYPVNDGNDIALVVITDNPVPAEGWESPAAADAVNGKIKTFAPPLQSLVASAKEWRQWSLYRMPPLSRWTSGRAALLGDAAHPMLPFLAQGAVMALEDAVTLADHVAASSENIEVAFRGYEQARRTRVAKVVDASLRNGRIYHLRGIQALARDAVMKMRSPRRIMEGFDWLYGWRLPSS